MHKGNSVIMGCVILHNPRLHRLPVESVLNAVAWIPLVAMRATGVGKVIDGKVVVGKSVGLQMFMLLLGFEMHVRLILLNVFIFRDGSPNEDDTNLVNERLLGESRLLGDF